MSETPPESPIPPAEPAQATPSWDELFKDQDPVKVKEALENSRKWEQRAKENFEKAQQFDALQESAKTEDQKVAERIKAAEDRAAQAESMALRFRIANEYKLSQEDAMALEHVASEEGMKTVADRLRAAAESGRRTPPKPQSLASGSSGEPKTGEKGRAAAALRSLRQG